MPVSCEGETATITGFCSVEEAEDLQAWLMAPEAPRLDLSGCEHLHAAALQVLLARPPARVRFPKVPALRRLMQPLDLVEVLNKLLPKS